ncbi:MAG TPA: hypothetical protein VKU40_01320, partial [Thermoanaerobaculia bacterium]|nr:hypothetical protein [Thermoanaerobaculia bacterium]
GIADEALEKSWASRTARLASFRAGPGGRRLVVKVCDRWRSDQARTTFDVARRLGAEPDAGTSRARVLEVLDWSAAPPAVVSAHVAGEELTRWVDRCRGEDAGRLRPLMVAAGELLGRFHRRLPVPGNETGPPGRRRVHCAGDFAIYNFRVETPEDGDGDGDRLVYMEPPAWRRAVTPYRDLAWFLWALRCQLAGERRLYRGLRRAFLAGYLGADADWGVVDRLRLQFHLLRRRRARWRGRARQAAGRR